MTVWFAPGRIEVLGKHTDYAGGRSLVMAIEAGRPSIVRITGPMPDDEPLDADMGEMLLLPVEAERVADDAAFFELVSDLVDLHWDEGVEFSELLTIVEIRI